MPQIRPLSDLQDKLNDIYEVIHKTDQPMFFTRDGEHDVVIMSYDTYNRNFINNSNHSIQTDSQSYVKTIDEEPQLPPDIEEQSSAEILQEARKKLQDMVDEYSNDFNINVSKPRPKKRRRRSQ